MQHGEHFPSSKLRLEKRARLLGFEICALWRTDGRLVRLYLIELEPSGIFEKHLGIGLEWIRYRGRKEGIKIMNLGLWGWMGVCAIHRNWRHFCGEGDSIVLRWLCLFFFAEFSDNPNNVGRGIKILKSFKSKRHSSSLT